MAASVAMILDAAAASATPEAEPNGDGANSGAPMTTAAVPASTSTPPQGQDAKQPEADTTTPSETPRTLVVDTSAPATSAPVKKGTPTGSRAKNTLGIISSKKKAKKKSRAASHPSVGMSVDAMDKNKLWGNGRILEVDVEQQRLKITFPGFGKSWDIWTDMLSIAPHCTCSNYPRTNVRSWDGKTNLFTGERIKIDDDDEDEADGDDAYASPERVQASHNDEVVLAPSKPPVRKPKKGYVLVPVTEADAAVASSAQPKAEKLRKSSATLKREATQPLESGIAKPPKKARAPREPREAAAAPPPVREPFNDPEVVRQRALNESAMQRSAAFLSQCAELWKQQLSVMSERDRKELFADKTADAMEEKPTAEVTVASAGVVLESTVV